MTKSHFHKTWYFRLIQVLFWGSLLFFSIVLILLGIFESDVEIAGFFWSGVLALVYLLLKRILYYILFGESIFALKGVRK